MMSRVSMQAPFCCRLLLKSGAEMKKNYEGETPVDLAEEEFKSVFEEFKEGMTTVYYLFCFLSDATLYSLSYTCTNVCFCCSFSFPKQTVPLIYVLPSQHKQLAHNVIF